MARGRGLKTTIHTHMPVSTAESAMVYHTGGYLCQEYYSSLQWAPCPSSSPYLMPMWIPWTAYASSKMPLPTAKKSVRLRKKLSHASALELPLRSSRGLFLMLRKRPDEIHPRQPRHKGKARQGKGWRYKGLCKEMAARYHFQLCNSMW